MRTTSTVLLGLLILCAIAIYASPASADVSAYQISHSSDLLTGGWAEGLTGDYMLENDKIAVVISRIGHDVSPATTGGSIIDAGSSVDRIDALGNLYTYFDDDWPRQAEYQTIVIINNGEGGGPARIRATGHDSDLQYLNVITDYTLGQFDSFVTISTTVNNTSNYSVSDFEVGDAFHWGECGKFAPGYGFELYGVTTEPWIAGIAEQVAYGYTSPPNTLWGPNGSYWSDMNVTTFDLDPMDSDSYTRYFIVDGKDLGAIAAIVHEIAGDVIGTVECLVDDDELGLPIDNATIDTYDDQDAIYVQMKTDHTGTTTTTLPPGDWRLVASAIGYDSEETTITLTEGETENVYFDLVPGGSEYMPIGDTLTVIQRPLLNIPTIVAAGDEFDISCDADPATTGWEAKLRHGNIEVPLQILSAAYDWSIMWWVLSVQVPAVPLYELYDLEVTADGEIEDVTADAVRVLPEIKDNYYFIQITDTHLPTHMYNYQPGAESDTSEVADLRAVMDDIHIINPEFILLTGDIVNEGELEDYLGWRVYTRAQHLMVECQVPTYLTSGNHDIGGWIDTPPPAGTARRDWWRFFGWKRLDSPPPGAPWYTQNYSFDYGPVHYIALESYDNYDMWRSEIYGAQSFTSGQFQWLGQDLAGATGSTSQVLFYHFDFSNQINLNGLGVEMALWGHIHRDDGDIHTQPYDLSTNNTCDGERAYRLIRVSNGIVTPSETISTGPDDGNLRVNYMPANDGTNMVVTAEITNNFTEGFEHAQLRFLMPKERGEYSVTGGSLFQVDDSDSIAVCYVDVDIAPTSFQIVTVTLDSSGVADDDPPLIRPWLGTNRPNPFGSGTFLRYGLPEADHGRLTIFDSNGREVAVLVDGQCPAGRHFTEWDGRDMQGRRVPSGTYLVRFEVRNSVVTQKIVLAR